MIPAILYALLRTTLVLTLCGGLCFLALRKSEYRLPRISRLLWLAVLLTGWFWLQPVIQIPVEVQSPPVVKLVINESPERSNAERRDDVDQNVSAAPSGHFVTLHSRLSFAEEHLNKSPERSNAERRDGVVQKVSAAPSGHFAALHSRLSLIYVVLFSLWLTGIRFSRSQFHFVVESFYDST